MARILVAESDPDVLALIERALESWGHDAVRYKPGAELPAVDLMILEPGMGARAVAVAEVLASATPPVPLLVVSIYPADLGLRGLRPAAHLLKPFALNELAAAVEKGLRAGRRLR